MLNAISDKINRRVSDGENNLDCVLFVASLDEGAKTANFSLFLEPVRVHIPTSHLPEIRPNIIHPSTPRSPQ